MIKKRIKKDIAIQLTLTTNGEGQDLAGSDLRIEIAHEQPTKAAPVIISDYDVNGANLTFVFHGKHQRELGKYTISVWENYGKTGQTVVDKPRCIELVATTDEEQNEDDASLDISTVDLGIADMKLGIAGKDFTYEDFTPEQLEALQKPLFDKAKEMDGVIEEAHGIIDQTAFVNEALEAVYGDAGIAMSDHVATVSGSRYYYDSHPIVLHPGDVIKVTCTRNNGTALLNTSLLLVTFAPAETMLEYTAKQDITVYVATYGREDAQGCAYVIRRTDNLIDLCKNALRTIDALTKRVEELERRK